MKIIISDFNQHQNFLPLSFTRSIADFRVGILTIKEKWEALANLPVFVHTEEYLQKKYATYEFGSDSIVVNASIIPNKEIVEEILKIRKTRLTKGDITIAYHNNTDDISIIPENNAEYNKDIDVLKSNSDIFTLNGKCIKSDFSTITESRKSAELSKTNIVIGNNPVFIEEGAFVECTTLNTNDGPVYIGRNAKIMEGSNIRGPFAICESGEVKMSAKIYGPTTIGPWCKVGGEINNAVFFAYSSKAHDGFLGNAVIGEWCNLGADTNNSNLKNNYAIVKLWNYETERFKNTGLQFCGLVMGDHSKSGINTMFNTGTVVGVSANIFGSGFPRNFVPSFSWGGHAGLSEYKLNTAFDVMSKVMQRRGKELTNTDKEVFQHIFEITSKYRNF